MNRKSLVIYSFPIRPGKFTRLEKLFYVKENYGLYKNLCIPGEILWDLEERRQVSSHYDIVSGWTY